MAIESAPNAPPIEDSPSVTLVVEANATLGLASMQNAVPVVRQIQIRNGTTNTLTDVEVHVACAPVFAQGARIRYSSIAPGEARTITPVDLKPDYEYLFQLDESVNGSISVCAIVDNTKLAETIVATEILSYDQWAGTRSLPELIAAFSMPNSPVVDQLNSKASRLLRSSDAALSMDGYQSKNRGTVWKQISAVFSTLAAEEIQYAEPPASFGNSGQKIRTPDRILAARVATCLDLTMLIASCLEQTGLRPLVLISEGHAWVGCWLIPTNFGTALVDDVQAVRKRVQSGELMVFETTGLAQQQKPSLRFASGQGNDKLEDGANFRYAIDIHRARELQIKPLPSRGLPLDASSIKDGAAPPMVEAPPELPSLDPALLPIINGDDAATTPEGRLNRWKAKLLDLTLRNRLLNFKTTKSNLQLAAPNLVEIEAALSEGKTFKLRPQPKIMEGDDPRMALVHRVRAGETPLESLARDAFEKNELIVAIDADKLDGRLLDIFSTAQNSLQEGGANTLYMAIGFLKWREVERAETSHLAPILMVPVSLQRQSVRSGFTLTKHDDEAIINPTLLQILREQFQLKLPKVELLSTQEKGADVRKILQAFRLAITDAKGWEVLEQVHLGIFSFTKYLMWKDLQDRTEQLKKNSVVAHLIEHPGDAFQNQEPSVREHALDEEYLPQDIFAPLLFDSSQLHCICAASEGNNLVIEGPPGTGKSQTITNLIAHTLASGKSVLFVSEKMAALEVVNRRLHDMGLGPFCLELHSSKAKKADVVQQLGRALDFKIASNAEDWEREAKRLAALRQELNGVVQALHRIDQNGLSVFKATGLCIKHARWKAAEMAWPEPNVHDRSQLDSLRETARQIATLAAEFPNLASHPLSLVARDEWTPTWQDELLDAATTLVKSVEMLVATSTPIFKLLGMPETGHSAAQFAALDRLADKLLGVPKVSAGLARHAHDEIIRSRVRTLRTHGVERQRQWSVLANTYMESVLRLNASEIENDWNQAVVDWWPKRLLSKRRVKSRFLPHRIDKKRPLDAEMTETLSTLVRISEEDRALEAMRADAEALLQDSYVGTKTNWSDIEQQEEWAKDFSDAVIDMACGDLSAIEPMRRRLIPYISENRSMLAPGSVLCNGLEEYRAAYRKLLGDVNCVEELAQCTNAFLGQTNAGGFISRLLSVMQNWSHAARQLQTWCFWRGIRAKAIAQGLQNAVLALEKEEILLHDFATYFEYSYQAWWLKKTLDREPVLAKFASVDHQRKILEFQQTDERFQDLTRKYIVARLASALPARTTTSPGADSEMGLLRREMSRQRGHMAVRRLVQGLPMLLPKLKPCLLMSPLSVAQYLDASHATYDLVVFDEASQIPVWDAVGAIARGKQVVIVGDPKQLPPTNFFNKGNDDDSDDVVGGDITDLQSILDECMGAGLRTERLKWHYRSKHESLITFSNTNYYESQLITFPSPVTDDMAVRYQPVNGIYDRGGSRTNLAEAEAVVAAIEKHYLNPERSGTTVGVVTFNQPQQSLITTLLDARRRSNSGLDQALAQENHESLIIKNLENVQGDERDIIFFSTTYGADSAGRMSLNFGPLNLEGGHRRLNVAITRAREGVTIFSSLRPEQIDLSRVRAPGVRDLKNYLEYAIRGPRAIVEQSVPTGREPDSPFEEEVIRRLRNRGWIVHPQVGCSGYRVDIGVVDPQAPGRYFLGIECDGRSYHSGATARDRDRLRQSILEKLGWRIHRIWSTDWWTDAHGQMEKLHLHLEKILLEQNAEKVDAAVTPGESTIPRSETETFTPSAKDSPPPPSAENGLKTYIAGTLSASPKSDFYSYSASDTLKLQLLNLTKCEGPIAEMELFRKVARAWEMERTGNKIVERLASLIPPTVPTTKEDGKTYYWPEDIDPKSWTGFRVAGQFTSSQRNVADICRQELANLIIHALNSSGSTSETELARTVCRLVGMARTTKDAEERVIKVVKRMAKDLLLVVENDRVRLN